MGLFFEKKDMGEYWGITDRIPRAPVFFLVIIANAVVETVVKRIVRTNIELAKNLVIVNFILAALVIIIVLETLYYRKILPNRYKKRGLKVEIIADVKTEPKVKVKAEIRLYKTKAA